MPKVSVIIATYNRARYLCDAIDSVLAQTYTNYEIIVVDDGSTDKTRKKLTKYGDKIKYIYQENRGPTIAEIVAIENSKGEYIASLDDDDLWMPNKLEMQIKLLDADPGLAFVCAAAYVINEENDIIDTYESGQYGETSFNGLMRDNFVLHSTAVLRRKHYDDVGGFDPGVTITHDIDLWLRLVKKYRFVYKKEFLIKYRIHRNNYTKDLGLWFADRLKLFKKKEIMEGVSIFEKRRYIAMTHYKFGGFYSKDNQFYKAAINYLKAIILCPNIGCYYWPLETEKFRFTLIYRFLKTYYLVASNFVKAVSCL